jgi:hypothetical protein
LKTRLGWSCHKHGRNGPKIVIGKFHGITGKTKNEMVGLGVHYRSFECDDGGDRWEWGRMETRHLLS